MGEKLGSTSTSIGACGLCGQIFLILINILFIILGIVAVAIGIWAIVVGMSFSFVTGSTVIGGSAILIIVGFAIIIIAAIGMFGAMCKNRPMLIIYMLVVLVIVILEIIAGALAIAFNGVVVAFIENGIQTRLIESYTVNPPSDSNSVVDFFQLNFGCCGVNNASDWSVLNPEAIRDNGDHPPSCLRCQIGQDNCATFDYTYNTTFMNMTIVQSGTFNTTSVGCFGVDSTPLLGLAIGAGVVGLVFGFLEIIGIIIALALCCCITSAKRQEVV